MILKRLHVSRDIFSLSKALNINEADISSFKRVAPSIKSREKVLLQKRRQTYRNGYRLLS